MSSAKPAFHAADPSRTSLTSPFELSEAPIEYHALTPLSPASRNLFVLAV